MLVFMLKIVMILGNNVKKVNFCHNFGGFLIKIPHLFGHNFKKAIFGSKFGFFNVEMLVFW